MNHKYKILCDAMRCKHIEPMRRAKGKKPFLGTCNAETANMLKRQCISYEEKKGDVES